MTAQMEIVMGVLVLAIVLFIFEFVRVDVVGIIMMVILPILGVVTPKEAISGLSSNAVVSIIAVIIIGAGLDKTGVMNVLARKILQIAGKAENRIVTLISGTVAFISSFMQNIGAAALFMPAAIRIGKQTGIPISRILMPMGFCAIIGGTMTLVGASPTILLNDLIEQANSLGFMPEKIEPLGLFTQTPIGVALVASAIIYFIVLGKYVLPANSSEDSDSSLVPDSIVDTYDMIDAIYELEVPEDHDDRRNLEQLTIREQYHISIIAIYNSRKQTKTLAPSRTSRLEKKDTFAVIAHSKRIVAAMAKDMGYILKPDLDIFAEDLSPNNAGLMEGIVTQRSELVGKKLGEVHFTESFEAIPITICTDGYCHFNDLPEHRFKPGDAVLMFGTWRVFHWLKSKSTFVFTTEVKGELMRTEKAIIAIVWLIVALGLVMGFEPLMNALGHPGMKLSLSDCLLTGALGMILSNVISIDEAYESVDWMTVFLLGGLIPLGLAFQKTGAAEFIATTIMTTIGSVPTIVFLLVVGILTSFFTLVVSNVGATVLLVPLCMSMAVQAGADPRITAMVVAIAASNTFVLPTHQVNALIMRPGGYRTMDYAKAGAGMTVLFLIVLIGMLYLFY
ncbi:MAG: SLC13 family permease [Deltaproteobacteria bacterium]|nr:MAG: SLC13 family permease [Deltaproteobacteria bacterium]